MPGIVGLITKMPRSRAEVELRSMLGVMRHEPFYRIGMWCHEGLGVYVGWSVRDRAFAATMPIQNERGDAVLVFSGEDYPAPDTRRRLNERGHVLATDGPSYLVHLFEEDAAFPAGLNGRFHGLVADLGRQEARLFNDRYGIHRLYYHDTADAFYFAAEAKALLALRPELRVVDPQSLGEFVSCGCVLENRSLFKGISILPPASAWVFRNGTRTQTTYFDKREWETQDPLEPEEYYESIRDAFSSNLSRYFSGDEPIAMSLTGGLDTRMIMSWQAAPPGSLPCYSFGGMFRDCHDVRIARRVASAVGQGHVVIPVGAEFLSRFAHYSERTVYLTDGCVDVRHSTDLFANERAREIAPVRMTGNYGGEIMRRVRAFKPVMPAAGLFRPELLSLVDTASHTYAALVEEHPLSFALFRQTPWHHYGLLSLEQTQLTLRSPYLDNDFVRTVYRAPASALTSNAVCLRLIAEGNRTLGRIRTDRGLGGSQSWVLGAVRHAMLESSFKAEYAYDYGMPQWVAAVDHRLSRLHLERLFLGRHKFYHFRVWYRDALSSFVQQMLLDSRTLSRPYLDRNILERMVHGHLRGDQNFTSEIHKVLTLELLHRLFVDSGSANAQHPGPATVGLTSASLHSAMGAR